MKDFFQPKNFGDNGSTMNDNVWMRGGVTGHTSSSTMGVEDYLVSKEPTPNASSPCPVAPSVEYNGNQKQMEEGCGKDDISDVVIRESQECNVNKKSLRCTTHDCDVRSMSVTNKKWQWNERNNQYMYMSKKAGSMYVCMSVGAKSNRC